MTKHERRFDPSRAALLDDPQRMEWLPIGEVLAALHLHPGQSVADIGAGTGYFTLPMAAAVGGGGVLYAVDVSPEMLDHLRRKLTAANRTNVQCVEAEAAATGLPDASVDLVFLANVWHEFDDQAAVLHEAQRLLRPSGRVAILDWRPDVEREPGPPLAHRVARSAAEETLRANGWHLQTGCNVGRYSWLIMAQPTATDRATSPAQNGKEGM